MGYTRVLHGWLVIFFVVVTPFWRSYVHARVEKIVEVDGPVRPLQPYTPLKGPFNTGTWSEQLQGPTGSCVLYSNARMACPGKSLSNDLHPFYTNHPGSAFRAVLIKTPAHIDRVFFLVNWVIENTITGDYIFAFEKNGDVAHGFANGGVLEVARITKRTNLQTYSVEFPMILAGQKGIWVSSFKSDGPISYSTVNRYLYDSGKLDELWAQRGELVLGQVIADGSIIDRLQLQKTSGGKLLVYGVLAPGEKDAKDARYFLSVYTEDGKPEPGFGQAFEVYSVKDGKKVTIKGTVIVENYSDRSMSNLEIFELKTGGFLIISDYGLNNKGTRDKTHYLISKNGALLKNLRVAKEIDANKETLKDWAFGAISWLDIKSIKRIDFHTGETHRIVNMTDGRIFYLEPLFTVNRYELERTTFGASLFGLLGQ